MIIDVEAILDEMIQTAVDGSKEVCPVKTGALKASIHREGDEVVAGGESAPYAGYVEYGTEKMEGRYYMLQGFLKMVNATPDIIRKHIR